MRLLDAVLKSRLIKQRDKKNKEKDEETVGVVIKPAPTTPTTEEPDPVENVPDSDNAESIDNDLEVSSQENDSGDDNDIDKYMERMFAMMNSGFDEDADKFDGQVLC